MDWFVLSAITIHALIWGGAFLIIIYLIYRRIQIKKTEDFEDRDN